MAGLPVLAEVFQVLTVVGMVVPVVFTVAEAVLRGIAAMEEQEPLMRTVQAAVGRAVKVPV
jgi:hypothetical protein